MGKNGVDAEHPWDTRCVPAPPCVLLQSARCPEPQPSGKQPWGRPRPPCFPSLPAPPRARRQVSPGTCGENQACHLTVPKTTPPSPQGGWRVKRGPGCEHREPLCSGNWPLRVQLGAPPPPLCPAPSLDSPCLVTAASSPSCLRFAGEGREGRAGGRLAHLICRHLVLLSP